ncbi:MAG: type II toxin-antitoxin system Phd/YefM family antitoxin [Bryobacteraceae bacterium]
MKVTATEFRKNMFQLVEKALAGELVEVSHRGRTVRLVPEKPTSKLSRLQNMNVIVGTPEELDEALSRLSSETQATWEAAQQE